MTITGNGMRIFLDPFQDHPVSPETQHFKVSVNSRYHNLPSESPFLSTFPPEQILFLLLLLLLFLFLLLLLLFSLLDSC